MVDAKARLSIGLGVVQFESTGMCMQPHVQHPGRVRKLRDGKNMRMRACAGVCVSEAEKVCVSAPKAC